MKKIIGILIICVLLFVFIWSISGNINTDRFLLNQLSKDNKDKLELLMNNYKGANEYCEIKEKNYNYILIFASSYISPEFEINILSISEGTNNIIVTYDDAESKPKKFSKFIFPESEAFVKRRPRQYKSKLLRIYNPDNKPIVIYEQGNKNSCKKFTGGVICDKNTGMRGYINSSLENVVPFQYADIMEYFDFKNEIFIDQDILVALYDNHKQADIYNKNLELIDTINALDSISFDSGHFLIDGKIASYKNSELNITQYNMASGDWVANENELSIYNEVGEVLDYIKIINEDGVSVIKTMNFVKKLNVDDAHISEGWSGSSIKSHHWCIRGTNLYKTIYYDYKTNKIKIDNL